MFKKAVPVWVAANNYYEQLNTHLVFKAELENLQNSLLKIAAANFYKLYVNGQFVGFGPARTAKGYARVDEYELSAFNNANGNEILVMVAGYYCKSLSTALGNSFFAAELQMNGKVVAYSGKDFRCFKNLERVKKVERYSVQRHFGEVYELDGSPLICDKAEVETVKVTPAPQFIDRIVPYADFSEYTLDKFVSRGVFAEGGREGRTNAYSYDAYDEVKNPKYGAFPREEIKHTPFRYVESLSQAKTSGEGELPQTLNKGEWMLFDFGAINVGFIGLTARALEDSEIIIAFSEHCSHEKFEFVASMNAQNVVQYNLKKGVELNAESFEPYGLKNLAIFLKSGSVIVEKVGVRSYMRDMSDIIKREIKDPELRKIYNGAVRTFAHNVVDIYMDCPTRERAGWLCDSYFTGRAEHFFFGTTTVEDAYLQNYVLYKNEGNYPNGILPMAYPSDPHGNCTYIPQWCIWYVLEVCEYLNLRNPAANKELFRPSVMGVLNHFEKLENELGLLERIPGWNFIEWSKANSWCQDVNYPTNMLYSAMLCDIENTFGVKGLKAKAEHIRKTVIDMAFNGEVFVDNAVRDENGNLKNTNNVSEAAQYYAALFGGIDLSEPKFASLLETIKKGFGEFAKTVGDKYDFCPINAFIGMYLRMNVLHNLGDPNLMAENLKSFFGGISDLTGTLWETKTLSGSLDHGFASYAACTIPLADSK